MFDLRAIITALMYETKPLERRTAVSPRRGDMMMVNAKYTGGPCIVYIFLPEEKRHNMQKSAYGSKNLFHFDNQNCSSEYSIPLYTRTLCSVYYICRVCLENFSPQSINLSETSQVFRLLFFLRNHWQRFGLNNHPSIHLMKSTL